MARSTRAVARYLVLVLLALTLSGAGVRAVDEEQLEGRAPTAEELQPSVEAAFAAESYAPGETAKLVLFGAARGVSVRLFRSGPEHQPTVGNDELVGIPVTAASLVGQTHSGQAVAIRLGQWPSGLYFARLHAADGRVGFAAFVLRP